MEPMPREFGSFKGRSGTRAFTEIKPTPVVLVCIYNHNNTLITHETLRKIFSQYGQVLRILIFEKVKVWKAFVEFSTLESAFEAKRKLNDYQIFPDGTRLNVYFSNLDVIKFQNNNAGGIDYTIQDGGDGTDGSERFQNFQHQPNLLQQNAIPVRNEMTIPTNPFIQPIKKQDSPTNPVKFDDKGDEDFLKIISNPPIDKDHTSTEDEEAEPDNNTEKAAFNPFLMGIFQPQPIQSLQNVPMQNTNFMKPTNESAPFQFQGRRAGHRPTAPPGLLGHSQGMFPPSNYGEKKVLINSPGSFGHISNGFSPVKTGPLGYKPGSGQELPRPVQMPGTSQFDPHQTMQGMQANNFVSYPFNMEKQSHNRVMSLGGPITSGGQNINDVNDGSPDSLSHQNLFELIDTYSGNTVTGTGVEDNKSPVIYVKGLDDPDINVQMVYNLFGNFGNVLKIIFIHSKAAALIEYENADYATIAKDYLNNIVLLRKPLRIFYSNFSIVNLRHKKIAKDSGEEILVPNPKTYRFKKNKNISINPPSATLHISNLAQEVCNEESMRAFFGNYCTILALQFIVKDGKWMCLMKLASIEESINTMAILNDMPFGGGRRVQLSFTRSKI